MFNIRSVVDQDCGMRELTASRSVSLVRYNLIEQIIYLLFHRQRRFRLHTELALIVY